MLFFVCKTKNCNENGELWDNMLSLEYILLIMIWMLLFPAFLWAIVILSNVCQGKHIFFSIWLIDVSHIVLFATKLGYNIDAYPVYYPKWATHIILGLLNVDKILYIFPLCLYLYHLIYIYNSLYLYIEWVLKNIQKVYKYIYQLKWDP